MANGLKKILGYTYLTGLVEDIKTGIPTNVPDAFWSLTTDTIGDSGRYTRMAGVRTTLPRVEYDAPSVRIALEPVGVFDVKLPNYFAHIQLRKTDYDLLRAYDGYSPMNEGRAEVDRQAAHFVTKRENTKIAMVHSMLAKGAIYFDSNGNILPTSSGAALTVDYGVAAAHQNQLNNGTAAIITASWGTASTNIPLQLENLNTRALRETGYPVKYAFYGRNIPGYLAANDYTKDWLIRNPTMQAAWLNQPSVIPQGLFGLTWVPVDSSFYVDQDGTTQTWFGADQITFAPEITRDVYTYMRGTYNVPTTFQPFDSVQSALGSIKRVTGDYGYAVPIWNPVSAELHLGHVGMPVWLVPDALWIADVTP